MKISILILFVILQQIQLVFNSEHELAITTGLIQGKSVEFRGVTVKQFLGIPYAEPPLNELRFSKPVPKKPWNGVLKTDQWGNRCLQPIVLGLYDGKQTFDEDCLILNVFATEAAIKDSKDGSNSKLRPVMFWIHGGGFLYGSANDYVSFDGTAFVAIQDVVLVSINYRLGPFGFLHLPEAQVPGNMGLWDQNLALKWVKDNIHYFGGDPNKVTIYGESAGSLSVSAHLVSPQSKGLFANAILMSGALSDFDRWIFKDVGKTFATKIGCENQDYKSCLDLYHFDKFKDTQHLMFWPISGDEFLPSHPDQIVANHGVDPEVNVLLGTVGNEGACMIMFKDPITFNPNNPLNVSLSDAKLILKHFFGESLVNFYLDKYFAQVSPHGYDTIRLNLGQALGDTILTCPTYAFGRGLALNGNSNVYAYYQSQRPASGPFPIFSQSSWLPATHGDDIPMVFGHPLNSDKYSADDVILSYVMMDIWAKFAREGKPPKISHQDWLPWSQRESFSYPTMELNANKFGIIETKPAQFCFDNWPFPFEKPYWFDIELGIFAKMKGKHDEL
ncbi:cholinesterase [Tetranychus urticae]|uniref:Carboxylic ester hydrolase n=1 Tax=Tetranychus urticae TaxID=32264 RepID=T1KWE1_TETUR|nr:cholinesterase [Tetranychus urticae]